MASFELGGRGGGAKKDDSDKEWAPSVDRYYITSTE